MAKVEEEIECDYCESKFEIQYDDTKTYGKLSLCPFCGEELSYVEEEAEDDDNW